MQKKYTIFVSSTYYDLKEQRAAVYEPILKTGHIPVGMEHFGSRSTRPVEVIRPFLTVIIGRVFNRRAIQKT